MRKAESSQITNRRTPTALTPQNANSASSKIMENISYLNRTCKFLSFAEKERLIDQLKAQDQDTEYLVSSLRENNVPKEEVKTILYAFLYPKQATKKALDSMNSQRSRQTGSQGPHSSSQLKKSGVVPAVKLELGVGSSQIQKGAKSQERTPTSQGGKSLLKVDNTVKDNESGKNKNKELTGNFGKGINSNTPKTPGSILDVANTPKYQSAKGQNQNIEYVDDISPHSRQNDQGFEATSEEFLTSLGINPNKATGGSSFTGMVPAGVHIKIDNASKGGRIAKELTFGAHGNTKFESKKSSIGKDLRSKDGDNRETFGPRQDKGHEIALEGSSSPLDSNIWKQAGLPKPGESDGKQSKGKRSFDKGGLEAKHIDFSKEKREGFSGSERRSEKGDFRLSGVSERTKEVLQSLLGDIGNGEMYQNLMKKLEENNAQSGVDSRNQIEDIETEYDLMQIRKVPKGIARSVLGMEQAKMNESNNGRKVEDENDEGTIDIKRFKSLGDEHTLTTRTEKYVSVNMIKRILDSNSIYTEDIVDEVFRYLGENIVNKNYFAQIIGNYLNCLSEQHGIQTQDIVNKMFEICDRNGDGVISPNDLGSGATLFSQYRPNISKERRLYRLLDPQNRGFIIETDIISVLTKTNTIANSSGMKLYESTEEINAVAKKLVKELDKEKKGIVTYWDIFLWKDTQNFSDLITQLERYTNKLDFLSSTKKPLISASSPPHDKNQDLLSEFNKKSPVQPASDLPRLYTAYSPDVRTHQGSASFRVNTVASELPKSSQVGAQTARVVSTNEFAIYTPATTDIIQTTHAIPQSYSHPYQSPGNLGLLQHLSPFDSLSKDAIDEQTSVVKDYQVDLTMSPHSKSQTPIREIEEMSNGLRISPKVEEKTKTPGEIDLGKYKEETKGKNKGSENVNNPEAMRTNGNDTYTTTYEYNFESKTYNAGYSLDKGNLDLPFKTLVSDTQSKNQLGQSVSKDYLQGSGLGNYAPETNSFQSKPYTSNYENKVTSNIGEQDFGYTGSLGTQTYTFAPTVTTTVENKEYSYTPINYDNLQATQKEDLFVCGTRNYDAKSYSYIKDTSVDKKDDNFAIDILNKKELQQSIYVAEMKDSRITDPLNYQYEKIGHGFNDALNDYKKNEIDYGSGMKPSVDYGDQGSFVNSQKSPEKKSYLEDDSQNYGFRDYGSGSYPYGSDYKDKLKEGKYSEKDTSSPEPRGYQEEFGSEESNYKGEWYQDSEGKKKYVSLESDNLYRKGSDASGQKVHSTNYYGYESESPIKY